MSPKKKEVQRKAPPPKKKEQVTKQKARKDATNSGKRKAKKEKGELVKDKLVATTESFHSSDIRLTDVLLGRGSGISSWHGNRLFRRLVWAHRERYVNSYRTEKHLVALQVVEELQSQSPPGRFLEKIGPSTFKVVSAQRALEKTCQSVSRSSLV